MTICPFKVLTGWDCPLCGATRATLQLLQGHTAQAFDYNALYLLLLPAVAWMVVGAVVARLWGRRLPEIRLSGRHYAVLATVAVVFTLVRNQPLGPGPYLHT